jgi:hypothetical protein
MTHTNAQTQRTVLRHGMGTCRTTVALTAPVRGALAAEIERRVYYIYPGITGYVIEVHDDEVREVTLLSAQPLGDDVLADRVNQVVDREVRGHPAAHDRTVWTSTHRRAADESVVDRLVSAGAVSEAGEGQMALGEPLLSLLSYFDGVVRAALARNFDPREYRYPTLIPTAALQRAGYPAAFPHHLMFVTRLPNDIEAYQAFQRDYGDAPIDPAVLGACRNVDYCLPPTMCYHTFHQYRGRRLDPDGLHVVTSRGKAFRHEAAYSASLERLWDFTIREIVFLGSREAVLTAREHFMLQMLGIVDALGLSGWCEVANDPFFGAANSIERIWSQRLMELKYELRLHIAPDRTVAVGSFNFHAEHFGRAFEIGHLPERPVHSACVGFGLERLVFAFLCQYGPDRDDWPDDVRTGTR